MRSIPFFLLIVNFFLFTTNSAFANRAEFITEIVNNLKNNLDELPQEDGNGSMRWNELNGITPEGHECLAYLTKVMLKVIRSQTSGVILREVQRL